MWRRRRRFFMADKESVVRQTSEYTDIMEKKSYGNSMA